MSFGRRPCNLRPRERGGIVYNSIEIVKIDSTFVRRRLILRGVMSSINDPSNRGFLLPGGCKDLIDALHLRKAQVMNPQVLSQLQIRSPGSKGGGLNFPKRGARRLEVVQLASEVTVRQLAGALQIPLAKLIELLQRRKLFTGVEQKLPFYTAAKIAWQFGVVVQRKRSSDGADF